MCVISFFFFFKQKTAYEMRISDWSSDVCSSDLACCSIRKVEPLRRALRGRSAWLTGQRRAQSLTRTELPKAEFDPVFGLQKYNPLAAWTQDDVWAAIKQDRKSTRLNSSH